MLGLALLGANLVHKTKFWPSVTEFDCTMSANNAPTSSTTSTAPRAAHARALDNGVFNTPHAHAPHSVGCVCSAASCSVFLSRSSTLGERTMTSRSSPSRSGLPDQGSHSHCVCAVCACAKCSCRSRSAPDVTITIAPSPQKPKLKRQAWRKVVPFSPIKRLVHGKSALA